MNTKIKCWLNPKTGHLRGAVGSNRQSRTWCVCEALARDSVRGDRVGVGRPSPDGFRTRWTANKVS